MKWWLIRLITEHFSNSCKPRLVVKDEIYHSDLIQISLTSQPISAEWSVLGPVSSCSWWGWNHSSPALVLSPFFQRSKWGMSAFAGSRNPLLVTKADRHLPCRNRQRFRHILCKFNQSLRESVRNNTLTKVIKVWWALPAWRAPFGMKENYKRFFALHYRVPFLFALYMHHLWKWSGLIKHRVFADLASFDGFLGKGLRDILDEQQKEQYAEVASTHQLE